MVFALLINDNYYFPSTTIKIPIFPACQNINIIKKQLQNFFYHIIYVYPSGG